MATKPVKKPAAKRRATPIKAPAKAGKKPDIAAKTAPQESVPAEFQPRRRFRV